MRPREFIAALEPSPWQGGAQRAHANHKARLHPPRAQFEASISSDYSDRPDSSSAFSKIFDDVNFQPRSR
jgi:hypothetical protein